MGVGVGEEAQQWPRRSRLLETTRLAQRNRAPLVREVVDGDVVEDVVAAEALKQPLPRLRKRRIRIRKIWIRTRLRQTTRAWT